MSHGLVSGNNILGSAAGSYYGQWSDNLPGYQFFLASGYTALKAQIDNRFPIWIPSQERGRARKRMQIPFGAQVYHIGARAGKGVWSEAAQDLVVTTVASGTPVPARSINLDTLSASASLNALTPPIPSEIFRVNGIGDVVTRTTLLRQARTSPSAFDAARLDAFNQPISYTKVDGTIEGLAPIELELQTRTGVGGGVDGALSSISPTVGGLRQNADAPNEAYILLQIGFYLPTSKVVTTDDFAGVVWDEVFANV